MEREQFTKEVIAAAKQELADELFKERVKQYKEYLKLKRTFWMRVFPWRIRFERRIPRK